MKVLPRNDNDNWAKVEIKVRPESTTLLPEGVYSNAYRLANLEQQQRQKLFSSAVTPEIAASNTESELEKLEQYFIKHARYLPRSITSWSNRWLTAIRFEIVRRYKEIWAEWEARSFSNQRSLVVDREIGLVCYSLQDGRNTQLEKTLRTFCDADKPWLGIGSTTSIGAGIVRYDSLQKINQDIAQNFRTLNLKWLKHYLVTRVAQKEVAREYNYRQYVDVKFDVDPPDLSSADSQSQSIYLTWSRGKTLRNEGLWRLVSDLLYRYVADVYAVNPDESAQRIQDIAEVSRVFGLNFGAQFLAGNLGGEAALSYLKGKEKLFANIVRKPVVIGLPGESLPAECSDTGNCRPAGLKFGWLVGPVFRIKNDRQDAEFLQVPTKKTVSVDVSLPSWWRSLSMDAEMSWVKSSNLSTTGVDKRELAAVDNPVFLNATSFEPQELFRTSPRPIVTAIKPKPDTIRVHGDQKSVLIIEGKNAWRVHSVTVGNSASDEIEVLGDMEGIRVSIPRLKPTACIDPEPVTDKDGQVIECQAPIRLWSRHADTVDYGTAKLVWKPTQELSETPLSEIIAAAIYPSAGLSFKKSAPGTPKIKIVGKGFQQLSPESELRVHFGDQSITSGISVRNEADGSSALLFKVSPLDAWDAACPNIDITTEQKSCPIQIDVFFKKKLLTNASVAYTLLRVKE